ncbi:hypothetical protein AKJ09_07907 [Labilithrix luteola]|uniref:Uncharacterized protein n=1 Tax=Labilithrix luteola TaxID=1391654 RepID=A0A0K1Q6A8_9BACT|nr:hypothetical protein AKJ09_07907 [Labilithrix luteola]
MIPAAPLQASWRCAASFAPYVERRRDGDGPSPSRAGQPSVTPGRCPNRLVLSSMKYAVHVRAGVVP